MYFVVLFESFFCMEWNVSGDFLCVCVRAEIICVKEQCQFLSLTMGLSAAWPSAPFSPTLYASTSSYFPLVFFLLVNHYC